MTIRLEAQAARDRAMSTTELARLLDTLVPCPEPDCVFRYLGLARTTLRAHLREVHNWSATELRGWRS